MTGFTLPTSRRITQAWGAEFDDWDGDGIVDYPGGFYNSIGWDGHNGIDYGCGLGDPIYAVADGVVTWAAWAGSHWLLSGGGNAVLIEHAEYGVQTEYLHLSRFAVTAGQRVTKDQVIGYAGKTGAATGYHLHLGMLPLKGINLNNRARGRIDPTPWLYGNLNPDYAGGLAAMGGTITPLSEEDDMSAAGEKAILDLLNGMNSKLDGIVEDGKYGTEYEQRVNVKVDELVGNAQKTFWNSEEAKIRLQNTSPAEFAAAVPQDMAQAFLDALAARLGGK